MNIKKIIILLSLVSFLSCSTDIDIIDCESEELHTCYATFNIKENHFYDEFSSRAGGDWFNSLTDNMSLRFYNQDGNVNLGYAIYNKDKEIWEITYEGSITCNEKQKVEIFLVRGGCIYIWNDYCRFYETTEYYSDSEAEYIRKPNGEICIQATLKPLTGRIRFKGTPGETFTLSGLSTSNYYNIKTGQLTVIDSPITLSIGSNGFSSYVYGNFTNRTSPTLSIETGNNTFTASCPTSMLNVGKSGWMKLPDLFEHTGWTIEKTDNTINGHEYVDLALPSGTLWATCNVGAESPEEYGDLFAWGEISPKSFYADNNYHYSSNPVTLPLEHDVAYIKWGKGWRMPTESEMRELTEYCWHFWSTKNNVNGLEVTSKQNGHSLFLPAAGEYETDDLWKKGTHGYYWSSSIRAGIDSWAGYLWFDSDNFSLNYWYRYYGHSIRPVCTR